MNRARFAGAVAVCVLGSSALAQSWPPTEFQATMLRNDNAYATITVGGLWTDTCTPRGAITFSYAPGRLHMNIDHGWPTGGGCGDAITPWSRTVTSPPLGNGILELHVSMTYANGTQLGPSFVGLLVTNAGCVADIDDGSGSCTPDGSMTIDDLLFFLSLYERGAPDADVDDGSATRAPDGGVTIDDLVFYLFHYEAGC